MRIIKFRVWDLENKTWENPSILEVWNDSGKLEPFKYIKTGKLNPLYSPIENYIIQQFTGVYDKNQKEIYEGDIIKWIDPSTIHENVLVTYDEVSAGFKLNLSWNKCSFSHISRERIEILGNIYENPELLEK